MTELEFKTAEAWRPDDPKADGVHENPIEGVLTDVQMFTGGAWEDYPIVFIQTDSGQEVAIHAFRTVLLSELKSKAPKIGERIRVSYGGPKDPKDPKSYYQYRVVVVGRDGGEVNWGAFGDGDDHVPPVVAPKTEAKAKDEPDTPKTPADDDIPF